MAQIKCENLSLGYKGNIIVSNLSFSVNAGDYFCIVGENGAGKSTLMKTLLNLLPPISGKVTLGDGVHANEIGYLPQQTLVQKDFPASVKEIVLSGCQSRCGLRPFYNKSEKLIAKNAIAKMDITEISNRCYRELSGGQQQRVLLARALCSARKILLLDEPVSGLDPKATAEMYEIINHLNKNEGLTVIMISHDISAALSYSNRILHIGNKCFCSTTEEYINSNIGKGFSELNGGVNDGLCD